MNNQVAELKRKLMQQDNRIFELENEVLSLKAQLPVKK